MHPMVQSSSLARVSQLWLSVAPLSNPTLPRTALPHLLPHGASFHPTKLCQPIAEMFSPFYCYCALEATTYTLTRRTLLPLLAFPRQPLPPSLYLL